MASKTLVLPVKSAKTTVELTPILFFLRGKRWFDMAQASRCSGEKSRIAPALARNDPQQLSVDGGMRRMASCTG
ncbi:hypothetical protein [Variovorax sp. Root473]|uniref:hypothetical protein n=1 Tax=Variovorax sp. Root473 TaxID=1736541 RepID=UPI00138F1626|nr:hypothetical protein [Variovorax sp. Root473]